MLEHDCSVQQLSMRLRPACCKSDVEEDLVAEEDVTQAEFSFAANVETLFESNVKASSRMLALPANSWFSVRRRWMKRSKRRRSQPNASLCDVSVCVHFFLLSGKDKEKVSGPFQRVKWFSVAFLPEPKREKPAPTLSPTLVPQLAS